MTNNYYDLDTFTKNTLARAEDIQAMSAALVTSFDLLPELDPWIQDRLSYATTTGSANVYAIALPTTVLSLVEGLHIRAKIHAANTGASTINVDTIGAIAMQRPDGSALTEGDLPLDSIMDMTYDGSVFKIGSTLSDATAAAASAAAAAADAVSTAADVVLTNADVVSTNADVVSTNADVVTTNAATAKFPTLVSNEFLQTNAGATAYASKSASEMRTALGLATSDTPTFAGVNLGDENLNDYDEGTWTPVLTFATAGDLSVAYSSQSGRYIKIGKLVVASFIIETSTFTHTTASGACQITGLPFASANVSPIQWAGPLSLWQGITRASYTDVATNMAHNVSLGGFIISGSAQTTANLGTTDMPTGGTVKLAGQFIYEAA